MTRKSTTGTIVLYAGRPVCWVSKKQPIVTLSSTEAELVAATESLKEAIKVKSIIKDLTGKEVNIRLLIDNQSTLQIIKNGLGYKKTKHVDIKYNYVHNNLKERILTLEYYPTNDQLADILTKPLNRIKFEKFKNELVYE